MTELTDFKRLVYEPERRMWREEMMRQVGRSRDVSFIQGLICGVVVTVLAGMFIYRLFF